MRLPDSPAAKADLRAGDKILEVDGRRQIVDRQRIENGVKFWNEYADLLAEIYVPHPHGGHAIPIAERSPSPRSTISPPVRFGHSVTSPGT